ncbi:hypothetical protein D7I43_22540 [Micromonospora globbae]|uniref:Uncharacterized protein n=1 Tax=Micromonospora globbae TaxID=1894969 RepID=A0A420EWV6_9ACTN|nr:hypothetical protein D7I43_22540 [Micromonospora globbae]
MPTDAAIAERRALALAVVDRHAADARDAGRDRIDVGAAHNAYVSAHRERFTQGRDTRTVDPDPRILPASDFAALAAEHLAGRLVVVGARQYVNFA